MFIQYHWKHYNRHDDDNGGDQSDDDDDDDKYYYIYIIIVIMIKCGFYIEATMLVPGLKIVLSSSI